MSLLTLNRNGKQFILAITISLPFFYFLSQELNHLQLPPASSFTSIGKKFSLKRDGQEEKRKDSREKNIVYL